MIEIDGEFFEDPCEEKKKEKIVAIVDLTMRAALACLTAKTELQKQIITDMAKVFTGAIMAQPLWPRFEQGGIIVSLPDQMAFEEMISNIDPLPSVNCPCIIGVDLGAPEGDRSI